MAVEDGLGTLVELVATRLPLIPIVTPEQYRQITCTRCGLCCEDIPVGENPAEIAASIANPATSEDWRRFISALEPSRQFAGEWRYRCRHFARDETGLGVCTVHATRPDVCRNFPYGKVVHQYRECAWFVEVRDEDGNRVDKVLPLPAGAPATIPHQAEELQQREGP